jgi:hypothetical protein
MREAVQLSVDEFSFDQWRKIRCLYVTVTDVKYLAVKIFGSAAWLILQTAEC